MFFGVKIASPNVYAQQETQVPTLPQISSEDELNYDQHYEQIALFILYMEDANPSSPELETANRWLQIIEDKTQIEVNQQMQSVINRTNLELPLYLSSVTLDDKPTVYDIYEDIDCLLTNRLTFVNNSYLLNDFNSSKIFVINCKNKIDKTEEDMAYSAQTMAKLDEDMTPILTRESFDESEETELRNLYSLSISLQSNYTSYLTTEEISRLQGYEEFLYNALKTFSKSPGSDLKSLAIYIVGAVCFLSVGVFIYLFIKKMPDAKYEISEKTSVKRRDLVGRYRLKNPDNSNDKDNQ